MPKQQDRRQREAEALRQFLSDRARLESKRLAVGEVDQASLGEASPVQRQRKSEWFEPEQPDPAPATTALAAGGEPRPDILVRAPWRTPRAWLLLASAVTLAVGMVLGLAVGSARSGGEPTSGPPTRAPVTQPALAPPHLGGGPASGFLGLPGDRQEGRRTHPPAGQEPAQQGRGPAGGLHRGKSAMPQGRLPMNTRHAASGGCAAEARMMTAAFDLSYAL
jgi:hypothetical protein